MNTTHWKEDTIISPMIQVSQLSQPPLWQAITSAKDLPIYTLLVI